MFRTSRLINGHGLGLGAQRLGFRVRGVRAQPDIRILQPRTPDTGSSSWYTPRNCLKSPGRLKAHLDRKVRVWGVQAEGLGLAVQVVEFTSTSF